MILINYYVTLVTETKLVNSNWHSKPFTGYEDISSRANAMLGPGLASDQSPNHQYRENKGQISKLPCSVTCIRDMSTKLHGATFKNGRKCVVGGRKCDKNKSR